jgi:hypothetical protein
MMPMTLGITFVLYYINLYHLIRDEAYIWHFLLLFEGALGIPRPKAFMWFGAVVKPGGGNLVLAGAEGPTDGTFEGPSPRPSNNFAHPDTLGGNLQIESRNRRGVIISFQTASHKNTCN